MDKKCKKYKFFIFIVIYKRTKYLIIKEAHELAVVSSSIDALEEQHLDKVNLGQHVLAEFFECDPNILNSSDKVEKYMIDAALECGATIVQKCFHMFNPYGVSGVVIISESHLAIHTWPELGYAAVDLFTCGTKCDPKVAYEFLKKMFNSKKASFTELKRGIIDRETLKLSEQPFEVAEQFEN